jgi:hypothetical protein
MSCDLPTLQVIGVDIPLGAFDIRVGTGANVLQVPYPARFYRELVSVDVASNGTTQTITDLEVGTVAERTKAVSNGILTGLGSALQVGMPLELDAEPIRLAGTLNGAQATVILLTFKIQREK